MTNKDECQPPFGDLLRDLPVHSFCFSRHQSQSRHTVRPMHISVGCRGLDMGVINNLAPCKVNAPLTIVELTNNRHAGHTHWRSRLCTFVSCTGSARFVKVGAGSSTCRTWLDRLQKPRLPRSAALGSSTFVAENSLKTSDRMFTGSGLEVSPLASTSHRLMKRGSESSVM